MYMCSTKTAHPLSHSCLGFTIIMLYPKAHSSLMFIYINIYIYIYIYIYIFLYIYIHIFFFAITSKGTMMEIRSTRSFNAIPATLIRGVFNLYLNLLYKIYCKYFIFSFIHLFCFFLFF